MFLSAEEAAKKKVQEYGADFKGKFNRISTLSKKRDVGNSLTEEEQHELRLLLQDMFD